MSQELLNTKKGEDADLGAVTCTSLTINGTPLTATSILLGVGDVVDLNGEADSLVLDADGNTSISAPTDNQIDIEVNGADDFRITANTFTALSGSTIAANTIAETTAASGVTIDGLLVKDAGIVAGTSGYVDLNGEAGGLVFDTDGNTKMYASADDVITVNVGGAADFTIGANALTALSGSAIVTNTINETTAASGVTVDSLLIKDGGFVAAGAIDANGQEFILDADADTSITADTDDQIDIKVSGADDFQITANTLTALSGSTIATNTIAETTAASGVTVDGVLLKDGGAVFADGASIEVDTVNEATAAAGVTIDGALIKDGVFGARQAIAGDGAITVQNAYVILSKGSAAAITIAAPTAGAQDGLEITVISETAQAHVITCATDGFNGKGASGTVTFGGAKGDSVILRADTGHWYTVAGRNYTPA